MRFFRIAALAGVPLIAFAGVAGAQKMKAPQKAEVEIKFATLAPDGSTWMKTMRKVDEEVRQKTANRVGLKFYPGGVQGDERDVIRKLRNGQIHAAGFTGFGLGAIVPETRVLELPFMFDSLDELDYVRTATNDYYEKAFKAKDYALLGWTDVGFVYLFTKAPVRTPSEMPGTRWWIWSGDQLAEIFYRAFNITPIPLAAPDVLTSLQTGVIDGVYASPLACVALQWFSRVKYMSEIPVTHGISAVVATEKSLAGVSAADRAILLDVMQRELAALTQKTRVQNGEAIGEIKKEGVQVVTIDAAARQEFVARGRAAWDDGVPALYPQALLDRVKTLLAEYRQSRPAGSPN